MVIKSVYSNSHVSISYLYNHLLNCFKYPLFIGDQMYWMDHFDKTQRGRSGQKYPKGFLEIIY